MDLNTGGYYQILTTTGCEIVYMWWCQKCLDYHYEQYCPRDELESLDFANLDNRKKTYFDICPNCGQFIKKES